MNTEHQAPAIERSTLTPAEIQANRNAIEARTTTCEVCERTGRDAGRCAFGHPSGPCSCWRSVPCDGRR